MQLNDRNSHTLCPLAWSHTCVNPNGHFQLCCEQTEGHHIKEEGGEPFHVATHSPEEVLSSASMQAVRTKMHAGEPLPQCSKCYRVEVAGGSSRRLKELQKNALIESTEINSLDLFLGNVCNLKCVMCSAYYSNSYNDYEALHQQKLSDLDKAELKRSASWARGEGFLNHLKKALPKLKTLYLSGGEPLMNKQLPVLLKYCIAYGYAGSMQLSINTNGTVFNCEINQMLIHFKQVLISVSLDGVGEVNDYIRYPSKWAAVEKVLKQYYKLSLCYDQLEVRVRSSVQNCNILQLPEILDYLGQFHGPLAVPLLEVLSTPKHLAISSLPSKVAQKAITKIAAWSKQNPGCPKQLKQSLKSIMAVLGGGETLNEWVEFEAFVQRNTMLRKQNLKLMTPELFIS